MNPILYGKVEKGKLILDYPEKLAVHLSSLEGKRIEMIVRKETTIRSNQQNKFYWSVVLEILANHFGYEPEEMHEALKFKFLKQHEESLVTVKSTTKLRTLEFADYIDKIMRWAANDYQIYIPNAGEVAL
jgi:hypothetical protein